MNTHELMECFNRRGADYLAGGCYGRVYSLPDTPGWIVKHGQNDGTRTYLEWVKQRTAQGRRLRGMPEIDFLWGNDERYIVTMKRYQPLKNRDAFFNPRNTTDPEVEYLRVLYKAFEEETGIKANDMHGGNFMQDGKTIIMTDPSADTYAPCGMKMKGTFDLTKEKYIEELQPHKEFELVG